MAVINREQDVQTFAPAWPDLATPRSEQLRFTYDWPSDTLFVDCFGEGRPAVSDPLDLGDRNYFYRRVDVQTNEVVGLQIEHFLSSAVLQHPALVDALAEAELVGIAPEEAARVRQRVRPGPNAGGDCHRVDLIARLRQLAA